MENFLSYLMKITWQLLEKSKKGELGALSQIPFGHKISTSLFQKRPNH